MFTTISTVRLHVSSFNLLKLERPMLSGLVSWKRLTCPHKKIASKFGKSQTIVFHGFLKPCFRKASQKTLRTYTTVVVLNCGPVRISKRNLKTLACSRRNIRLSCYTSEVSSRNSERKALNTLYEHLLLHSNRNTSRLNYQPIKKKAKHSFVRWTPRKRISLTPKLHFFCLQSSLQQPKISKPSLSYQTPPPPI